MELEEMKKIWEQTDSRLSTIEDQLSSMGENVMMARKRTALDSLALRYKRFSLVAILFAGTMVLYTVGDIIPGPWGPWICLAMAAYMLLVSGMDYWLYIKVKEIDVEGIGVSKVACMARYCRRKHLQFIMVLVPIAIVLVTALIYSFSDEIYMVYGAIAGLIFGLALGSRAFMKFMADYRSLREKPDSDSEC